MIRGIVHVDHKSAGNGVTLRFINGGVGQTFVYIELTSKRGSGINSTIYIYV